MIKIIKLISIGLLLAIIIFAGGYFTGKRYVKEKIIIKEVKIEDTKWKDEYLKLKAKHVERVDEISIDDYNRFVDCYNSPISFSHYTESNYLFVTAFDDCKENTIGLEIGTKGNWKIYVAVPLAFIAGYGGYQLYKKLK